MFLGPCKLIMIRLRSYKLENPPEYGKIKDNKRKHYIILVNAPRVMIKKKKHMLLKPQNPIIKKKTISYKLKNLLKRGKLRENMRKTTTFYLIHIAS